MGRGKYLAQAFKYFWSNLFLGCSRDALLEPDREDHFLQ